MSDALIWGASGGIGRALTNILIENNWRVFTAARDTTFTLDGIEEGYHFDAGDQSSVKDIALDLAHRTKGLDLWIYAAGDLQADLIRKMDVHAWNAVLDSNLNGAFITASQTLHLLNDGAQVVFIGAYIDHLILPKMGAYAVAKAGLETLIKVLQKEQRKQNFTLVKPGAVRSNFWENAPFKMPSSAKSPEIVAHEILTQVQNKKSGLLEL